MSVAGTDTSEPVRPRTTIGWLRASGIGPATLALATLAAIACQRSTQPNPEPAQPSSASAPVSALAPHPPPVPSTAASAPPPSTHAPCPESPLGGERSVEFMDCNDKPGQADYPECLTYALEPVQGEESKCPPTHLWLWVTGWSGIMDGYRVRLHPRSPGKLTELILEGQPGGTPGPMGPAPGNPGDLLAVVRLTERRITAFRPSSVLRRYNKGVFLKRFSD